MTYVPKSPPKVVAKFNQMYVETIIMCFSWSSQKDSSEPHYSMVIDEFDGHKF